MAINFGGNVYDDAGNAVSGASVKLLETGTTTQEGSTVTTDSNGRWDFGEADQDRYDVEITKGSSVRRIKWSDEISLQEIDVRNNTAAGTPAATFTNLTNNASNQVAVFSGANSTRADGDEIYLSFKLADSAGNIDEFARMTVDATDVTTTEEDGQIRFSVLVDGTLTDVFTINSSESAGTTMTLDVSGDLTLDTDGGDIFFKDGGTTFGSATNTGGNLILKSGTTTALTFSGANLTAAGTIGSGAITSTGIVKTDDTTEATSTTDGSLQTDGGLSVVKDAVFGDDVFLLSDSSVFNMGAGSDFTITHDGTTGATLAGNPITITSAAASTWSTSSGALTITSGAALNLNPTSGSAILLDGTISIDAGVLTGATAITSETIDATTDFTIGSTVITDDSIVMTPSTSDTVTIAAGTNGVLNITTVDNAAAAANIQITADGTAELAGTTVTLDSAADIELEATNDINVPSAVGLTFADDGQKIESDGTDFTIASGAKLNLTATSDVHVANGTGLVVGHTAQETISIGDGDTDLVPEVQVLGTAQADSSIMLASFSTTATAAGAPLLAFAKGGNASIGSHTIVTDDEELGNIIAYGDDGTDLEAVAAQIQFEVDGTPGTGDMPGRIVFATTADGAETATEAMRITSAGRVGIDVDPSTTLHVNAAGGAGVRISRDSNAGYLNLDTDGTNAHISNPGGSGTLIFKVNGDNERARIDANGTFTVGTDGSGGDVTFYSATSGDNLTWDASHEVLNITGTNGATALDVLDGDLRVVDTLYLYDRGGESISSDGTDLTIASGDDIFLTATGAVKVADKIGIGTEDAKGAFYFIPLNTQDVSTSATTISSGTDFGVLTFVTGEEGVVRFADLVIFGYDSVTVISSHSVRGSPASRSYSVSGQELKLAMGSGTYDISVLQMMGPDPT